MQRKSFISIKSFAERRDQFLDKWDATIERMPKVPLPEDHDRNLETTPSRLLQSRKRTQSSTAEEQSTSRLIQHSLSQFDPSQSSGVQGAT